MVHPRAVVAITAFLAAISLLGSAPASEPKELILLDPSGQRLLDPIQMTGVVTVRPDGSIEVTTDQPLACDTGGGCDGANVQLQSFTSSRTTAEAGQTIDFDWTSRGAWDCRAGGTLPGWTGRTGLPPNSANATTVQKRVNTADLEPGSYTATLRCENGPNVQGPAVSVPITIADPPPPEVGLPEFCANADRRPPSDWLRMNTNSQSCHWSGSNWLSGSDCRHWDQVFAGPFVPGGTGQTIYMGPRISSARSFIALRFNSGQFAPNTRGEFIINTAPNMRSARKLVSISECPGDFNEAAILDTDNGGTGCIISTVLDSLRWGGPDGGRTCRLEPDTQYFFNIIFTDDRLGDGLTWDDIEPHPDCVGARCGNLFRNRN